QPYEMFPNLERQFVTRGIEAGLLSLAAFIFIYGALAAAKWRWAVCAVFLMGWLACLGLIAALLHWSYRSALPVLSPYLADQILSHSVASYGLGLVLIVAMSSAFAWRLTASAQPIDDTESPLIASTERPLHQRIPVMSFFLLAAVCGSLGFWIWVSPWRLLGIPWSFNELLPTMLGM